MYKLNNISTPKKLLETVNKVNTQYSTMPEASTLQDRIVQYVGVNTDNYNTGYFYLSTDKSGSWRWELVSGGTGGGGGEEPVSLSGVEIPLDTETGMYIYMLPDELGMIYVASGYIVDFESETGFVESEGNSAIVVWLSNENKLLNTFSIEFGIHSFSFDESWTSADGTSYINLEGITLIEDTPASITADITYLLSQMLSIDQIAGLPEALANISKDLFTTLLLEDWVGEPLSNTCYFSEIREGSNPIVDIDTSEVISYAAAKSLREEFSKIYTTTTAEGSITFYAGEELTMSLPLKIKVV